MDEELRDRLGAAAYRRAGFAADYDRLRAVGGELREPVSWWLGYQLWLCLR